MANPLVVALLVAGWLVCLVIALAIKFTTGIRIRVSRIVIFLTACGALVGWIVLGFVNAVKQAINPDAPQVAEEHDFFQPLVRLAESQGGSYDVVGRAGRVTVGEGEAKYTISGKLAGDEIQLVVSSRLNQQGLRVELSRNEIRRRDLESFQTDDEKLNSMFSMASTDVSLAQAIFERHAEHLISLGSVTSLTTVRGNLELKQKVAAHDDAVSATFDTFKTIHGQLNRAA